MLCNKLLGRSIFCSCSHCSRLIQPLTPLAQRQQIEQQFFRMAIKSSHANSIRQQNEKKKQKLILRQCDDCIHYKANKLDLTMSGCDKNGEFADINRLTSFCGKDGKLFNIRKIN